MAVVRKVQSKLVPTPTPQKEEILDSEKLVLSPKANSRGDQKDFDGRTSKVKKQCQYCKTKNEPRYWDSTLLRRYINDRGRIMPRMRTGNCSKHQRRLSVAIKHSRHLALLPFKVRI